MKRLVTRVESLHHKPQENLFKIESAVVIESVNCDIKTGEKL